MDPNTIHDRISKADWSLTGELAAVPKGDYSGFAKLADHPRTEVREILVRFCDHFKEDWSREILIRLLRDPYGSVRSIAASALSERARPEDAPRLTEELKRQYAGLKPDDRNTEELAIALGNAGSPASVDPLLEARRLEKDPDRLLALDKALAKLGYEKEIRRMGLALERGSAEEIDRALSAVAYIGKPEWIGKVKPLLLDERVARHLELGPATFKVRVCDLAINTLRAIDPDAKVPDVPESQGPYKAEALKRWRTAYGLAE